ncbi:MAG TPA: pantoate--beta-alanine ligase [Candidatus Nanopelagicaceae bacterium]|nr:pantoate--beta-alanine ligase [Candidatus Nanopelagicaceae bacterium]
MQQVESIAELEVALSDKRNSLIALVPTMGALHAGHAALVAKAKELAPTVVLSIFVNPLQFGESSDFARYPRTLQADANSAESYGADILWTPREEDVYPQGLAVVKVDGGELSDEYEGAIRPGHFSGVLTVVGRLFAAVRPDVAVFGEKDRQQLELVRRMNSGLKIVGVPTVRESDGLALSSRNRFLVGEQRNQALAISRSIANAQLNTGLDVVGIKAGVARDLKDLQVEYAHLIDAKTWRPVPDDFSGEALLLIAAKVGSVHLIDNGELRIG